MKISKYLMLLVFLVSCGDIKKAEKALNVEERPEKSQVYKEEEEKETVRSDSEILSSIDCDGDAVAKVVYKDGDKTVYACASVNVDDSDRKELLKWCNYTYSEPVNGKLPISYVPKSGETIRVIPRYTLVNVDSDVVVLLVDANGEDVCRVRYWNGKILKIFSIKHYYEFTIEPK